MHKTKQTPPEVADALPASEPKSSTTAASVLPPTPKKKTLEDCKTAKERIEYYKDKITEEKATLRSQLNNQLEAARDTVLLLHDLGDTNVLGEDQYSEYRGTLGIVPKVETPPVHPQPGGKGGGGNPRKPRPAKKINAAIKRAGKPLTIPEIATATKMSVAELEAYFASESASQRFSKTGNTYTIRAK
jgi:hypothetical protein